MEQQFSLVAILRDDPDFSERLAHVKKEVEKDKVIIKKAATTYTQKYQSEVEEGTKKMQKLLTEGESNGLTEEEIINQYGKFLPTVRTPILNMLYFILRESEEIDRDLYQRRDLANKKIHGWEEEKAFESLKEPDDMFTYLYGHVTLDTFNKLKKLKALTYSPNIEESALAFKKCRELCEKYNIEYDKIPCRVS
jgi:hypothetical protein